MPGALFNILIPTKQHEIHLSQQIACDCSIKSKLQNDNTHNKQPADCPRYSLSITMEKVSTSCNTNHLLFYMHIPTIYILYIISFNKKNW